MPSPSRRRRFDDDDYEIPTHVVEVAANAAAALTSSAASSSTPSAASSLNTPPSSRPPADPLDEFDEPNWSNYADSSHGPSPAPPWVITSSAAVDEDLGVLKTGKEADVSLIRRTHANRTTLMAAKRYRDAHHRLFHRDAGYLEGRRVRRSREMRAMSTRTEFGRELISGQWAVAEFAVLSRLWSAGAPVPYPVQFDGTQLLMEFIGDDDGVAAPRLAALRPDREELGALYEQLLVALGALAAAGLTHGDLSAYNILVHHGQLVLIDVPQAVDLVANPQGFEFLRRDCQNICTWFAGRGLECDAATLESVLLDRVPGA